MDPEQGGALGRGSGFRLLLLVSLRLDLVVGGGRDSLSVSLFGGSLGGVSLVGGSLGGVSCFSFLSFSLLLLLEAGALFPPLLKHLSEIVKLLLEVVAALDGDLEARVRSSLDLGDGDVAPGREDVDHLCQLGHAGVPEPLKVQGLVLVHVEHILDDANILDRGQAVPDRDDIGQVLFPGSLLALVSLAGSNWSLLSGLLLLPLGVVGLGIGPVLASSFAILAATGGLATSLPLPGLGLLGRSGLIRGRLGLRRSVSRNWQLLGGGLGLSGGAGGGGSLGGHCCGLGLSSLHACEGT